MEPVFFFAGTERARYFALRKVTLSLRSQSADWLWQSVTPVPRRGSISSFFIFLYSLFFYSLVLCASGASSLRDGEIASP
jgi:hypothetical protein